jgi:hypothetical protein
MKTAIAFAAAAALFSGSAYAQIGCTYTAQGIPGAPVGAYSQPKGVVTVDGSNANATGPLANGSTVVTDANGGVNLQVSTKAISVGPDSIVCISQTGPDICVQVASSAVHADCSTVTAAQTTPSGTTPVENVVIPVVIAGGVTAAVLLNEDDDDDDNDDQPASK